MAKVHLIYFDLHTGYYPGFHHGLAYLVGMLKNEKHDVALSHLTDESDFEKTIEALNREKPDLVGLSFTTNQKKYVRGFLDKDNLNAKLIIAGGVHCTLSKEQVFENFPKIDGICVGEGEVPLQQLCYYLDNDQNYLTTPSFYFKVNNSIVKNPVTHLREIDNMVPPDYTLFDYQKIIRDSGNCFQMMLSRGCPYNCYYCCNHALRQTYLSKEKYVRFPSIQHSMKIIKSNLSLYPGTKKIVLADDTFTVNKEWLSDFCNQYKEEIGLPFLCNARVETINEEIVQWLKNAGCISINIGVESGNEWLRTNILNRKYTNKEIKAVFNIAKNYGIKQFSYNMVGLPFETKEMAKDTLKLNMELKPSYGKCFYFYPYPGTRLHKLCKDFDLLFDNTESLSGYLEAPSLKETFMSHKEMKKYFELAQVFFYSRLLFSKTKKFFLVEKLLLKVLFLFKEPVLLLLSSTTKSETILKSRRIMRRLAMKYLR